MFGSVTPQEMHTMSVVAGLTLAAWLGVGMVPVLRPHAMRIRGALLTFYLAAGIGLVAWLSLR